MNVTYTRDLRTIGDYTREIKRLSHADPELSHKQRLINIWERGRLLKQRALLREERATQVGAARARVLQREAVEDLVLAAALRKQYERLSRKSRSD